MPGKKRDASKKPKPATKPWEFVIYPEEVDRINEWTKEHDKKCPFAKNSGAIGGRMEYCFVPTSLSVAVKVKCCCGEEFDATDYLSW